MEKSGTVRVLVVQGYCLLRKLLIERLEREPWIEVCAIAAEIDEARDLVELHKPQVLVMNISLKCSAGISSLKKLKRDCFWLSVVAVSCSSEFENTYIGQALRAGADGYVSADDSMEDLVRAIRTSQNRKPYLSDLARRHRLDDMERENQLLRLSHREVEVFYLTGCGHVPRRIAELMDLSVRTVESYRERIRAKMRLRSGADLQYAATSFMRSAARRGIAGLDEETVKELLSATG